MEIVDHLHFSPQWWQWGYYLTSNNKILISGISFTVIHCWPCLTSVKSDYVISCYGREFYVQSCILASFFATVFYYTIFISLTTCILIKIRWPPDIYLLYRFSSNISSDPVSLLPTALYNGSLSDYELACLCQFILLQIFSEQAHIFRCTLWLQPRIIDNIQDSTLCLRLCFINFLPTIYT